MEKNEMPIVGTSAAAPVQAPVAASNVAAGASAVAPVQAPVAASNPAHRPPPPSPVDWDPYEPVQYDAPENPYDTTIVDNEPEVQSSDVDSDDESFHTKTRHVLRRLQSGHYDGPFARGIYKCPFCNRKLRATDFNSLVNHAESIGRCGARVGRTVNVHAYMAKHKALGIHLRNLQASHTRYLEALNVPTALSVWEIEELEAQVTSLKKDLVKGHEGKQSPNDKSGLGFNSNNKNKSTTHKRKKGHGHVKDPAKIVCFKCKIEGHHVRSCPLKKKPLGEKKQGKRPQDGAHGLPQGQAQGLPRLEERPLPKKDQAKAPVVEKSSEKKEKRRTCYICHEKGHISSFCTIGNSSNPILIHGAYSLHKDKVGDVFAKYVGTQSGFVKRTIWVAKPIVTNLLGPNLVGDQHGVYFTRSLGNPKRKV
ncbi:hypothetical protein QYE76_070173 [Lolium multiflorum]|uniref:CCHC-type domain-containing protein n=1 Tax=Lolium multiflorum TaxID=4521 RepID=A0AAD8WDP1_LOLMU|nr:hypothetical protein QYE76_070173 [Lolium multiflorum]